MSSHNRNPYSLREIFEAITLDLIASFQRTFRRHQQEQLKEGFQWEQWQIAKLRALYRFRRDNRHIIEGYAQEIKDTISDVLKQSFMSGKRRVEQALEMLFPEDLRLRGLNYAPPETRFFGINEQKLQSLISSVTSDMEQAQYAVLRRLDDVYRQTIFTAQMHMSSGAKTLNQAVDMATQDFLDRGINCIEYKDGRRVNVASYAEMALRTASQRATFMGEGQKRNEWGVFTIVVSAHANSCDLCLPWQAKVLIDDVYSGGQPDGQHPLLSEAMKAGLLHPNCRHTLSTFFPGISKLPEPVDEETARRNYRAEQKQRYMERQIRRWKRREAGSMDEDNRDAARAKVRYWQKQLREHLKENPQLRRDYWRERLLPETIESKTIKEYNKGEQPLRIPQFAASEITRKIKAGDYSTNLSHQQYLKHVRGSAQYNAYLASRAAKGGNPQSIITISETEAQELIRQKAGTGIIRTDRKGNPRPVESITADKTIGMYYRNGKYYPTNKASIHYGKRAAHLVPIKGDDYD